MSPFDRRFIRKACALGGRRFSRSDLQHIRVAVDGARVRLEHCPDGQFCCVWLEVDMATDSLRWNPSAFPTREFASGIFNEARRVLKASER